MNETDEVRTNLRKLCDDVGYYLGTTCQGVLVPNYPALERLVSQAQVDVAWLPPLPTLRARNNETAAPVLSMVRRGETSYQSALFVRDDSPYRSVADLDSARVSWVSPESASGYLVAKATLHTVGVRLRRAFAEEHFAGSHSQVVRDVWEKKADVGAGFVHVKEGSNNHEVVSASWTETETGGKFRILSLAGPIPTDCLVLHTSLYDDLATDIHQAYEWIKDRPSAKSFRPLFACDELRPCDKTFADRLSKLVRLGDVPQRMSS